MNYDIFISYNSKDSNEAKSIIKFLESKGYTLITSYSILFDNIITNFTKAIENSRLFIFLSSDNSYSSQWSMTEFGIAQALEKPIIPIRLDDSQIAGPLMYFQHIQYSAYEKGLLDYLERHLKKPKQEVLTKEQGGLNTQASKKRRKSAKDYEDYVPQNADFDIFISHRVVDGIGYARTIEQALKVLGYKKIFVDSIDEGHVKERIIDAVYSCTDFILIMTPQALEDCARKDSWVAREIKLALKYKKNIIPIEIENTFKGWPDNFPEKLSFIKDLKRHKLLLDEYFPDSIDKLVEMLHVQVDRINKYVVSLEDSQDTEHLNNDTVVYKIKVDRRCRLFIDEKEIQTLDAFNLETIPLPKGGYFRKVVDVENEDCFDEIPIILEHDKVDLVSLKNKRNNLDN